MRDAHWVGDCIDGFNFCIDDVLKVVFSFQLLELGNFVFVNVNSYVECVLSVAMRERASSYRFFFFFKYIYIYICVLC